jgi:hypothetical protein
VPLTNYTDSTNMLHELKVGGAVYVARAVKATYSAICSLRSWETPLLIMKRASRGKYAATACQHHLQCEDCSLASNEVQSVPPTTSNVMMKVMHPPMCPHGHLGRPTTRGTSTTNVRLTMLNSPPAIPSVIQKARHLLPTPVHAPPICLRSPPMLHTFNLSHTHKLCTIE